MSCGVGCRRGSDLALLLLWCRLAATAPIRPLVREPRYAAGTALKRQKDKKKKERKRKKQTNPKVLMPSSYSDLLVKREVYL